MQNSSATANQNWFHIRYSTDAPTGLPPVILADDVVRYRDHDGTWLIALWKNVNPDGEAVSACILRLPADQVHSVTSHDNLGDAASQN